MRPKAPWRSHRRQTMDGRSHRRQTVDRPGSEIHRLAAVATMWRNPPLGSGGYVVVGRGGGQSGMTMSAEQENPSLAPAALRHLSDEQTDRLTAVLDDYLARLENGEPPELEALLRQHADISEPLKLYLGKLGELHNFAAGFSPHLADSDVPITAAADDTPPEGLFTVGPDDTDKLDGIDQLAQSGNVFDKAASPGFLSTETESPPSHATASNTNRVPTKVLQGDIQAGRRLGDFQLLRVIGRGGMGIVYEAHQVSLRRRVAIKLLPLISVLDARQIARFKNEAQAAASLQHPNIVPVYAVGNYQGVHYYVMRFVDGQPLDAIIAALRHRQVQSTLKPALDGEGQPSQPPSPPPAESIDNLDAAADWSLPTSVERVLKLAIQAASALASAHEDGIIHRDIKPSNLMVDKQGKLWITDFGLARRMSDHSLTATGDILGTLRYMSPEQSRGQTALVDGRSDIYALGATLYELLALEPAITGENSPAMLRAIESRKPVSLRQHRPDVSRDLVTVIEKAMAKNREDRYLTAQLLADDLTRVLEGRPVLAKPTSVVMRAAKWVQRNQWLAGASVGISLLALLYFGAGLAVFITSRVSVLDSLKKFNDRHATLQRSLQEVYIEPLKEMELIPGAELVRYKMLHSLIENYRKFVQESREAPSANTGQSAIANEVLATVLTQMGHLYEQLGDLTEAQRLLIEAQQMHQELVRSSGGQVIHQRNLANCNDLLGRVALSRGDVTEAERSTRQAVKILSELVADDEESTSLLVDLAKSANHLALLSIEIDDQQASGLRDSISREEASGLLLQIQLKLEQQRTLSPEDTELMRALAATYTNLAGLFDQSEPATVIRFHQLSLDLRLKLSQSTDAFLPSSASLPSADLAITYSNLGKVLARSGQPEQAKQQFEEALNIGELLVKLTPYDHRYMRDLSVSYNNLGLAEYQLKQLADAEKHFKQAIELQKQLLQRRPGDAHLDHELGGTYNNLALTLQETGGINEVDANYDLAIEFQRQAVNAAPKVPAYRNFLDNHLANYSQWLRNSGRHELAIQRLVESRQLWPANHTHQLTVAKRMAQAAVDTATLDKNLAAANSYAEAAKETLHLANDAGLSVQSLMAVEPFSSLAKLKSLTELARP
ncbi:MAG: serine/threonine protein kinase [Pirellulaceae bacterium]|nr:serine/threonine protein kinase [Pirellulaceae bacterium]